MERTAIEELQYSKASLETLRSFGKAILRGVNVYAILSSEEGAPYYSNGWGITDIAQMLMWIMHKEDGLPKEVAREHVCKRFYIDYITVNGKTSFSEDVRCPRILWNGEEEACEKFKRPKLHAKVYVIDDKTSWIGSQNLYNSDLAQSCVLIDDKEYTTSLLNTYILPLIEATRYTRISGGGQGHCDVDFPEKPLW